jgi:hypothetical protein
MVTTTEAPVRRKWLAGSVVVMLGLALVAGQWRLCSSSHNNAELTAARGVCLALRGQDAEAVEAARQAMRRSATPTIAFAAQRVEIMVEMPIDERATAVDPDSASTPMQRQALDDISSRIADLDAQCEAAP